MKIAFVIMYFGTFVEDIVTVSINKDIKYTLLYDYKLVQLTIANLINLMAVCIEF